MQQSPKKLGWMTIATGVLIVVFVLMRMYLFVQTSEAQNVAWPDPPYNPVNISFSSGSTQNLIAAPTAGAVCVYGLSLTNAGGTATTMSIYLDGGSTAVATQYLAASGGNASWSLSNNPKNPWFITNLTTAFSVKSSAVTQINGSVYGATCP